VVLGVVRLGLQADWDRLEYLANYDLRLRQIVAAHGNGPTCAKENGPSGKRRMDFFPRRRAGKWEKEKPLTLPRQPRAVPVGQGAR